MQKDKIDAFNLLFRSLLISFCAKIRHVLSCRLIIQNEFNYPMHPIITRGLYILNSLFEGQKRFFKEFFFQKILPLSIVSIQKRVIMVRVQYLKPSLVMPQGKKNLCRNH